MTTVYKHFQTDAKDKRSRTRARILAATFEVIGHEHGRLSRVEQVTALAKIARPTFYTYFNGMEELLSALSHEISHKFNQAVTAYSYSLANAAETKSVAIRAYLHRAKVDHAWGWGMINLSYGAPILGLDTFRAATDTVAQGIEEGLFTIADTRLGRDIVLGTALAAMKSIVTEPCPDDYPEMVARHILISLGISSEQADKLIQLPLPIIED